MRGADLEYGARLQVGCPEPPCELLLGAGAFKNASVIANSHASRDDQPLRVESKRRIARRVSGFSRPQRQLKGCLRSRRLRRTSSNAAPAFGRRSSTASGQ